MPEKAPQHQELRRAPTTSRSHNHAAERAKPDPGPCHHINSGEAIANVELDAGGIRLVASITVEAVKQLGLAEGSEVTAVIKASDVILATG